MFVKNYVKMDTVEKYCIHEKIFVKSLTERNDGYIISIRNVGTRKLKHTKNITGELF